MYIFEGVRGLHPKVKGTSKIAQFSSVQKDKKQWKMGIAIYYKEVITTSIMELWYYIVV